MPRPDDKLGGAYRSPLRGLMAVKSEDAMKVGGWVIQTIGGILLLIVGKLSWSAWERLDQHEGRLIRVEMTTDQQRELLKEIRTDIKEIKRAIQEELNKRHSP